MRITQLRVTNYRGIEALSTKVPPGGLIVKGENGGGKTSALNAIRAALAANDIGSDAIRIGTDRAEILVDLEDVTVKRVITAKGSRLTVEGSDAKPVKAPQTWLDDVLGTAPLDPIDLFSAKPKERKAKILAALPIRVTQAQVSAWIGDMKQYAPETIDATLHGLEVVDLIRKAFAKHRTESSGRMKEIEKEIAALEAGAPPAVAGALSIEAAEGAERTASNALGELLARGRRVEEQAAKTQGTRERAAQLREEAAAIEAKPPFDQAYVVEKQGRLDLANDDVRTAEGAIRDLEARLAEARRDLEAKRTTRDLAQSDLTTAQAAAAADVREHARATSLRQQADALETAIAASLEVAPTDAEVISAQAVARNAADARVQAHAAKARADHEARIAEARTRQAKVEEEVGRLNGVIEKFSKEIPNQLLREANGIPGLAIDGDDVFLDGVVMGHLSGREQLLFAVEIARRLNVRAKILIVDGLERVDPDHLPAFVAKATSGGYQLIATRVDRGDVVLEAIEPEEPKATTTEATS